MSRFALDPRLLAAASLFCACANPTAAPLAASALDPPRANLLLEGVPPVDAALAAHLARYVSSRHATFVGWLPDGSMLVSTRFAEVAEIHRVAAPLAMREQLTYGPEPVTVAAAPRTGVAGFAYLKDGGGDENSQIYYYRLADHSVRALTSGRSHHGSLVWSKDGRELAFYGNERDEATDDTYVVDVAAGTAPRLVAAGQQGPWRPLDWSLDGGKLLLLQYRSLTEGALYIADVATGALTPLDTSGRRVGIRTARFAPDGRGVYVVSDATGEFAALRYLDPVTHQSRDLTANIPSDVDAFDVSADGRYVAYVVNEDGRSRLTVLDSVRRLELSPPGLPEGVISTLEFSRDGHRLALSAEGPQSPRDVYVFDLDHDVLEPWTHSEAGPIDPRTFVPAQLIHYPTWDRMDGGFRAISAYLYRPRTPGPHPVLIDIHGGPEAQYRPTFDPFIQFIVNELGYAVVAPNIRGSSGYGKSFLGLDDGLLREDAVKDIGSLLVWIGLQRDLDRAHVVVMGAGYGGYVALASLADYNDRLRGGIDVAGITDFVAFLEQTSPDRRVLARAEYGDERDPTVREFLRRISPLNNSQWIRRPLLVVQGLNDAGVPAAESAQLVATLRARGDDVWYVAAKDEGDGFAKRADRDAYEEIAAQFLARLNK
ncbi:MAG TPA: prolyl oligopeptidase family serine peptidase [Steroidobacteraceae bacterium]|nr:prolyl oligopeptidase family serine peptidase [Steroidobacteraceae bacterium]